MKITRTSKLTLGKESIRRLTDRALQAANGGAKSIAGKSLCHTCSNWPCGPTEQLPQY